MIGHIINYLLAILSGSTRAHTTRALIRSETKDNNIDIESATMIIDYASNILLVIGISMIALVIGSYWKRSLCRAYFYMFIVLYVVEEFMPARYGDFWTLLHS